MTPETLLRAARRFPLVARSRPTCGPLNERIREITDLVRAAADGTVPDPLAAAATAQNKAALIASDCGVPELARSLCRQQSELYLRSRPLTARTARYALEPLVNLARLRIRSGAPEAARDDLEKLYWAVRTKSSATIADEEVSFAGLTSSNDDHRELCQWLWGVMLAEGIRALVTADKWKEASAFAREHRGVGHRLLDGRQATIIASVLAGEPGSALTLVEQSTASEAWERAVAACLSMFCRHFAGHPPSIAETAKVRKYLSLDPQPGLATFRIRIVLTAIDLSGGTDSDGGDSIAHQIIRESPTVKDGYVAREILRSPSLQEKLTEDQKSYLSAAIKTAGLGEGAISDPLRAELLVATDKSRIITVEILKESTHSL